MSNAELVLYDPNSVRDRELESLHHEIRELKRQLAEARRETVLAKGDAARALGNLRKQLTPLYRALQAVFGEIESAGVPDAPEGAVSDRSLAVWAQWKQRLGEGPAKVIDALMTHGELNTGQLAVITGYHRTTIPAFIYKLNKNGLLNKNGGRFCLKPLT